MLKLGAILDGIRTRKDHSISLIFESQEITPEQGSKAMQLRNQFGWLLFSESHLTENDIPLEAPRGLAGGKSPGQRLRGVIFRLWEQSGSELDSETFYKQYMERIIDWVKSKLD